jgi:guanylate kinase
MTQESVIEKRLSQARNELLKIGDYKYALVNDQLEVAATEMRSIVLCERGEKGEAAKIARLCLTSARSRRLEAALKSFEVADAVEESK